MTVLTRASIDKPYRVPDRRGYRASDLDHPTHYRRGEVAEAQPTVPDWQFRGRRAPL